MRRLRLITLACAVYTRFLCDLGAGHSAPVNADFVKPALEVLTQRSIDPDQQVVSSRFNRACKPETITQAAMFVERKVERKERRHENQYEAAYDRYFTWDLR